MLTANIVEIALIIDFDSFIIKSSMDVEKFEEIMRALLLDSGVELTSLDVRRFGNMIPDDQKTVLWVNFEGTTLRPYNEKRFKQATADFLNTIQEVSDRGGIPLDAINIRLVHRRHHG